ncbi:MAG: PBP1A family penicillin-binding protein [Candidatus Latescibacteria bacterium]|nr:PBP1A family penicillin-binding protein [Candidatus Latescibacterota bacterium]
MKGWGRPLLWGCLFTGLVVLSAAGVGYWFVRDLMTGLPQLPANPVEMGVRKGTEIFAASGERIFTFNQSRQWVGKDDIEPRVIEALIATEDADFYRHRGVSIKALIGAVRANLFDGLGSRGGSTLTQQLVKRLFFSPEKTLRRKGREMLLATELEALYASTFPDTATDSRDQPYPRYKDHLLELYLNTVFYGANAYGIADAADIYFGRPPNQLTLPQAALLAGLVNAPSAYNPLRHPERATQRLQHVLQRMYEVGFLSHFDWIRYRGAQASDLVDPKHTPRNPIPYWVEAVKAEVARRWGADVLHHGSLRIYTTLDLDMQQAAEESVQYWLAALDQRLGFAPYTEASPHQRHEYVQAALVCLAPHSGQVKAMVGGRDIFASYYNRALSARRQPGSGFKPVAYLAALEAGVVSPLSLFVDEPRAYVSDGQRWRSFAPQNEVEGRTWYPRNYGGKYLDLTTAAWGLINSANSTAIQVTERVGPQAVADMARRLGFSSPIAPYLSIVLGVNEVTVLEMASAYGVLAASGLRVEPSLVQRIVDAEGDTLLDHTLQIEQALPPELAFQMVQLLSQAVDRGTGRRVRRMGFSRPAAGKTGTTNDNTDAWFTGFTPQLATSVWIGFDDRKEHRLVDTNGAQITGGGGAAPIWARFMEQALAGADTTAFAVPDGISLVQADPHTGTAPLATDSLALPAPLTLGLRRGEALATPRAVLAYEDSLARTLVDSVRREAWQQLPGSDDPDE